MFSFSEHLLELLELLELLLELDLLLFSLLLLLVLVFDKLFCVKIVLLSIKFSIISGVSRLSSVGLINFEEISEVSLSFIFESLNFGLYDNSFFKSFDVISSFIILSFIIDKWWSDNGFGVIGVLGVDILLLSLYSSNNLLLTELWDEFGCKCNNLYVKSLLCDLRFGELTLNITCLYNWSIVKGTSSTSSVISYKIIIYTKSIVGKFGALRWDELCWLIL